jgi:hypothetical protein
VQGYGHDKIIRLSRKFVILTLLTPVNASKYEREKKNPLEDLMVTQLLQTFHAFCGDKILIYDI